MSRTPPTDIIAAAQAGNIKWGVPAPVTLAQWALESNWGNDIPPGSNNPFGIKARLNKAGVAIDPFIMSPTCETVNGRTVHIEAPFRKFPTVADAFDYHDELLATGHCYVHAMVLRSNPDNFATALTGVYATDPKYGEKLIQIMRGSNLYQYSVRATA